ncbi:MAG: nucleoside hydrolase [Gammaproteobacteria bacterium]|nr:nucleoside hydrolase [Gammaproteobacteria bacterium]
MSLLIPVLIDTDANNEIDDQHAIAYALFSRNHLEVVGITVNNTPLGKGIQGHFDEAERVVRLCGCEDQVKVFKGAEKNFSDIAPRIQDSTFDGKEAVDFIVDQAKVERETPLVLIPIGKLTNIALALTVAPEIREKVRIVWLGSNYPDKGEYNLIADPESVNVVLESRAPFEIVTVRYVETTGSAAVRITKDAIQRGMPGLGPQVKAVEGRHGGQFKCFGDYSVNLFENFPRDPWSLFDVVAVAVVKDPTLGEYSEINVPRLDQQVWLHGSPQTFKVGMWEQFNSEGVIEDLFDTMKYQI